MFLGNAPMGTTYNSLDVGNNPMYPWEKFACGFGIAQDIDTPSLSMDI